MALDFLKNLFLSEKKKAIITHIMSLMAVISADGKVADEEAGLLRAIAAREGLTDEEFSDILNGKRMGVKPTVPKDEEKRIQYLKDATAMMMIDGNLNPEELKLCIGVGKRLGLPAEKVSEIITGIVAKFGVNEPKQDLPNEQQKDKSSADNGRFYFYNNRCSFRLTEKADWSTIKDDGLTAGLRTQTLGMVSIEILTKEPNHIYMSHDPVYTTMGFPVWATRHKMIKMDFYIIKCDDFYVEVTCDIGKDLKEFINSFKYEK